MTLKKAFLFTFVFFGLNLINNMNAYIFNIQEHIFSIRIFAESIKDSGISNHEIEAILNKCLSPYSLDEEEVLQFCKTLQKKYSASLTLEQNKELSLIQTKIINANSI